MVKYTSGAAMNYREGVYHARLRRLGTEASMDSRPSSLRSAGRESIVDKEIMLKRIVS
ncbi:MAG: hypothetical protein V7749_12085 [Cocleimonas sp.]